NRVLVTKPYNKTPYELLHGRTLSIGFMIPFGCPVTILNTLDSLGKFKRKVDEGFLVGYSVNSKAFRVFNSRTHIVQETLHVNFLENKSIVAGTGPTWLFDIDSLTRTMNYQPVTVGNQTNHSAGFQETFDADKAGEEANQQYVLFSVWSTSSSNPQNKEGDAAFDEKEHDAEKPESAVNLSPSNFKDFSEDSSNDVSAAGPIVPTAGQNYSNSTNPISAVEREDIAYSDHENIGAEADFNNLETSITVSPIPTTRIQNAHPISQIIGNMSSTTQTRSMTRVIKDQASTPIDTKKPLLKDPDGEDVDVHIYRSMIGSLMYLTSSRPDIMFADSPFDLVAYSGSDYAGASLDRKSTTEGCQFLGCRLISWQCKKQTVVATSSTEAEYVAGASCCRVEKGCSGVETPLFEGMLLVREPEEQSDAKEQGDEQEQGNADSAAEEPKTAVLEGAHFPMSLLQEALDACAALARRVEHLEQDKVAQDLEIIKLKTRVKKLKKTNKVKTLKLRRLRKVGTSQRVDTSDDTLMEDVSNQGRVIDRDEDAVKETEEVRENIVDVQVEGRQADIYHIDMDHAAKVLSMQKDKSEVQEAVKVVTTAKLITKVVAAVSETVSAAAVIPSVVPETISAAAIPTVTSLPVKVAIPSTQKKRSEEPKPIKKKQQVELDEAYARKLQEEINQDIDWEVAMDHVKQKAKDEPFIQRYQVMKKRPQTEAQAQQNIMMYLKNTAGFRLDYFKRMTYDDIRPIFEAKFNENMEFLLKSHEQIDEETKRAIKSINQTPSQKAANRRKLIKEAKEVENIKQHLQIVPDEDDDVYTEATPLARKVPVVDYQVILVNNKPRYKIIKANDTHQLYASFITMLKNFDREDLETLWSIVKEKFSTSKPNNFSDKYLLTALKTMFKRPDGQDNVWKNQSSVHG
nr:putative ribonuclease H-like domain-containing protein [Tanacetum cinerariifolium]